MEHKAYMSSDIRYAHTNLVARDWRKLSTFYEEVFDCEPIGVERDYSGKTVDKLTGMSGIRVSGRHLRLPGHGESGPTLEIFQYKPENPRSNLKLDGPGFAHMAFVVDDLESKRAEIVGHGGREVGDVVTIDIEGEGELTLIYIEDPEGNVLELQQWKNP